MTEDNKHGDGVRKEKEEVEDSATAALGLWREAALVLAAVLISALGSWFAFGRDAVTQGQVVNLIALHSPYVIDKAQIQAQLEANATAVQTLQGQIAAMQIQIANLRVTLARTEEELRGRLRGRP